MFANTNLVYPAIIILSNTQKNFSAMGRSMDVCAETISRSLQSAETSFENMEILAQQELKDAPDNIFSV